MKDLLGYCRNGFTTFVEDTHVVKEAKNILSSDARCIILNIITAGNRDADSVGQNVINSVRRSAIEVAFLQETPIDSWKQFTDIIDASQRICPEERGELTSTARNMRRYLKSYPVLDKAPIEIQGNQFTPQKVVEDLMDSRTQNELCETLAPSLCPTYFQGQKLPAAKLAC